MREVVHRLFEGVPQVTRAAEPELEAGAWASARLLCVLAVARPAWPAWVLHCIVLVMGVSGCTKGAGAKADISQDCQMNGFGQGTCSFTNQGDGKGAVCGHVEVVRSENDSLMERSSVFCSGEVGTKSTTRVQFSIPSVKTLCDAPEGEQWSDVCVFGFVAEGDDRAAGAPAVAASSKAEMDGVGAWRFGVTKLKDAAKCDASQKPVWCFEMPLKVVGHTVEPNLYFESADPDAKLVEILLSFSDCREAEVVKWLDDGLGKPTEEREGRRYYVGKKLFVAAQLPAEPSRCQVSFVLPDDAARIATLKTK